MRTPLLRISPERTSISKVPNRIGLVADGMGPPCVLSAELDPMREILIPWQS